MSSQDINNNHSLYGLDKPEFSVDIGLHGRTCPERQEIEHFIAAKYRQIHNAELNEYLPLLIGVHNKDELICGAGFRPGLYRPMFLEQYLDTPIEQQVATLSRQPVDRCSLVEIGNLAIASKGYGPFFMALMAAVLAEAGYEWMVFTVTAQVERLIGRLGFKPYYLAVADADRIVGDKSRWGNYYENSPHVMVGNLKTATEIISQNASLSKMLNGQQDNIGQLAQSLQDYRRLRIA